MIEFNSTAKATGIRLTVPFLAASNAICGGGLQPIRAIINYTLQKNDRPEVSVMADFGRQVARQFDYPPAETAVLLTAVPQQYRGMANNRLAIVTAGLGNAVSLQPAVVFDERHSTYTYTPGTVNCICLIPEPLTESALIEAYGLARATLALTIRDISRITHREEELVGTPTDGLVVACPLAKPSLRFAGWGSRIGTDIAASVQEALISALSFAHPDLAESLDQVQIG